MLGEHFYDGFIKEYRKEEAKDIIEKLLNRLNAGERMQTGDIDAALGDHIA